MRKTIYQAEGPKRVSKALVKASHVERSWLWNIHWYQLKASPVIYPAT
ncbi:hypothetical protein A2U01_0037789, partial [Trifolium medium]|nr:hypothetical protein [Trifolium medium]